MAGQRIDVVDVEFLDNRSRKILQVHAWLSPVSLGVVRGINERSEWVRRDRQTVLGLLRKIQVRLGRQQLPATSTHGL